MATIYALCDPRETDPKRSIRYIGVTVKTLVQRMGVHMSMARGDKDQTHRSRWMRKLLREGVTPQIVALETVDGSGLDREPQVIASYRAAGYRLTNMTDGGDGTVGWKPSKDTKAKIGEAVRQAWQNPEFAARMSEQRRAQRNTPEWKAAASKRTRHAHREDPLLGKRMAAARKPRTMTEAEHYRRSEALRRRWADPEYRAHMCALSASAAVRAKIGAATKRRCEDPAFRARLRASHQERDEAWYAKQSASQKRAWRDPEMRERRCEAMRQGWNTEARKRLSETAHARLSTPEQRIELSARARRQWADPEFRARWMAIRHPGKAVGNEAAA